MAGNGGFVAHPNDPDEEPEPEDEERENKATVRRYIEKAWNDADLSAVDSLVAANYRRHQGGRVRSGRDALKRQIEASHGAFKNHRLDIEELIGEGDKVVARLTVLGTDEGRGLLGEAPTGRSVRFSSTGIYRLDGGLIAESWHDLDELGLLRQLGHVLPKPEGSP
jgi:predicted ester cyclase